MLKTNTRIAVCLSCLLLIAASGVLLAVGPSHDMHVMIHQHYPNLFPYRGGCSELGLSWRVAHSRHAMCGIGIAIAALAGGMGIVFAVRLRREPKDPM